MASLKLEIAQPGIAVVKRLLLPALCAVTAFTGIVLEIFVKIIVAVTAFFVFKLSEFEYLVDLFCLYAFPFQYLLRMTPLAPDFCMLACQTEL